MAVNLAKISADLEHPDPQIQTFALMSITRLSPQIVDSPGEIQQIAARLEPLGHAENPDVVFLARKAHNHLDTHFKESLAAVREDTGSPPQMPAAPVRRDPGEMSREEILPLLGTLDDSNYLSALVMQLAEKGQAGDLAAVRPLLSHADDRVRSNAVEVFQAHGDSSSLDVLRPLLEDKNNRVRANTLMAMHALGEPSIESPLAAMLADPALSMRESAVYVLSQIEGPFVERLLSRALEDPYDGVRLRAVRALARFPTRIAVQALKKALHDLDINVCEAAADSLRAIKALVTARAGKEAAAAAVVDSAPEGTSFTGKPASPGGSAPPEKDPRREGRSKAYLDLGTEIYQLCRLNLVTHEALDSIFYEILRYQDFLRAYTVRRGGRDQPSVRPEAVGELRNKISRSIEQLGHTAAELLSRRELTLPEEGSGGVKKALSALARDRS